MEVNCLMEVHGGPTCNRAMSLSFLYIVYWLSSDKVTWIAYSFSCTQNQAALLMYIHHCITSDHDACSSIFCMEFVAGSASCMSLLTSYRQGRQPHPAIAMHAGDVLSYSMHQPHTLPLLSWPSSLACIMNLTWSSSTVDMILLYFALFRVAFTSAIAFICGQISNGSIKRKSLKFNWCKYGTSSINTAHDRVIL